MMTTITVMVMMVVVVVVMMVVVVVVMTVLVVMIVMMLAWHILQCLLHPLASIVHHGVPPSPTATTPTATTPTILLTGTCHRLSEYYTITTYTTTIHTYVHHVS